MELRPYQAECISALRKLYTAGKKAPLLVLPTGGGKTVIFSTVVAGAVAKGGRVLVLVHREELLRQSAAALERVGVARGLIHPAFTEELWKPAQVASVQTLVRPTRLAKLAKNPPTLIVIDEAHHAPASQWKKIIAAFPDARVLGVTATPVRRDGKGLAGLFDSIFVGSTVRDLIDAGYLVEPLVFAPSRPDLEGVKVSGTDYNQEQLADAMDKPTITGDAIAHYRKLAHGLPAVAFCTNIKHAQRVAESFREAGYRAICVDGSMNREERAEALAGLGNGSIDVVTSCDVISEGTDIPAIGCAILLRPTKSLGLHIQQIGRALRPCAGKDRAIILDHAGNCHAFGLPDEDREWSLEGLPKKKKGEKRVAIKQCPTCYAVHKPALQVCPACGHKYVAKPRILREVAGELVQLSGKEKAMKRISDEQREVNQARTLDELKEIAKARGYLPGWAERKFYSRPENSKPPTDFKSLFSQP